MKYIPNRFVYNIINITLDGSSSYNTSRNLYIIMIKYFVESDGSASVLKFAVCRKYKMCGFCFYIEEIIPDRNKYFRCYRTDIV